MSLQSALFRDKKLEGLFVLPIMLFFIASIPTSKAVMNLFSAFSLFMLIGYMVRHKYDVYRGFFVSFFLAYLFFAGMAFLFHESIEDLSLFLIKNSFLVVIPVLSIFFVDDDNLDRALGVFVLFCFISAAKSIYDYVSVGGGSIRVTGFLDYSRHLNALLLGYCIAITYVFRERKHVFFMTLVLLTITVSVIASGTRGAWLAFFMTVVFMTLCYFRSLMPKLILLIALVIIGFLVIQPDAISYFFHRIQSISNIETDGSNMSRISMWNGGYLYLLHVLEHAPNKFFFGSGMHSAAKEYFSFLDSLPSPLQDSFKLDGSYLGGTDFHSAILDLSIKSGVIYSVSILVSLVSILFFCLFGKFKGSNSAIIVSSYFVGLFTMIPFYSLLQDYSAFTVAFAVSMIISRYLRQRA